MRSVATMREAVPAATATREDRIRRLMELPEANVAAVSLLLHLPWEMGQMRFYRCTETRSRAQTARFCILASLGDAAIALGSFWAVARATGTRRWIRNPSLQEVVGFVGAGLATTVLFEWLATEVLDRWEYAPGMPTLPRLGTGLGPLLQWALLPPLPLWLARRRLAGASGEP
jgi:hypothetical protein